MDLSKLSDADLLALKAGDLSRVSDAGLIALKGAQQLEDDRKAYDPTADMSGLDKFLAGLGKAVADTGRGLGQVVGVVNRDDVAESRARDAALMQSGAARAGNFAGNAAMIAPTAMIPGAATIPGAAVIGAATGLAQPSTSTRETLANTALGGVVGAGGQAAANKLATVFSNRLAAATAEAAKRKSQMAVKDASLAAGREAGYVVPKSDVSPSLATNLVESFGGKAAVRQQATMRNQEVTNSLTRKALGLPDDVALSQTVLDNLRKTAGKTYAEVASLSQKAADDLEALKVARNEAQGWFAAYNRSARPDDLAKAKAARELTEQLEQSLEAEAKTAGRDELVRALKEARKQIAKTYTVERALVKGSGDVDARVIGRLYDKNKPLSDGLDVVGRFQSAYPKFAGLAPSTQAPGVSYLDAIAMPTLGGITSMATDSPAGWAAAALPLLRGPARSLALSKATQGAPVYAPGLMTRLPAQASPEMLGLIPRIAAPYGLLATE